MNRARSVENMNKLYRVTEPKGFDRAGARNTALSKALEEEKTRADMRVSQVRGGQPQYVVSHYVEPRSSVEVQLCHVSDDEP